MAKKQELGYKQATYDKVLHYIKKTKYATYTELRSLGIKPYERNQKIFLYSFNKILRDLERQKKIEIIIKNKNKIIRYIK